MDADTLRRLREVKSRAVDLIAAEWLLPEEDAIDIVTPEGETDIDPIAWTSARSVFGDDDPINVDSLRKFGYHVEQLDPSVRVYVEAI